MAKAATKATAKPVDPLVKIRAAAMLLKQASDPTRLQVLLLLSEKERNVGELVIAAHTLSQPACSHHLSLLRHGRLIEPRRDGKHNYYGLTDSGRALVAAVTPIVG